MTCRPSECEVPIMLLVKYKLVSRFMMVKFSFHLFFLFLPSIQNAVTVTRTCTVFRVWQNIGQERKVTVFCGNWVGT